MGKQIIKGRRVLIGGFNMSGNSNDVSLTATADVKDATVDNSGDAKVKLPGLKSFDLSVKGLWESDDDNGLLLDKQMFDQIGLDGQVMTATQIQGATVGDLAYLGEILHGSYQPFGKVGEVTPFTVSAEGSGMLVRGYFGVDQVIDASGQGSSKVFAALTAADAMWASIHVIAASGAAPTLDVIVESDSSDAWDSPITRITFSRFTTIGGQLLRVVGAIADTRWRFKWTVGGAGSSFTVVAAYGVALI